MDNKRNIVLLVEGEKAEVKLFERIIECFPEIKLTKDDILVYNTNLWVLNQELSELFGNDWYLSDELDFRDFLVSKFPEVKHKKITDLFLVFDYERQDMKFNPDVLVNLCKFFNDSVENGLLYINYPMIESYKHINVATLPDQGFKDRRCDVSDIRNYKATVGKESKHQDLRKFNRELFQQVIRQNIQKISYIIGNDYDLSEDELMEFCENIDLVDVAVKQNCYSSLPSSFVYVLCTCVLFVSNYNRRLITDL